MRKIVLLAVLFMFIAEVPVSYAHPPSDMKVEFNPSTRILVLIITHPVDSPESHFVKKIEVSLNTNKVIEHKISKQDNGGSQFATYMVPDAKLGDTILVEAYCSINGKLTRELEVTK